MEMKEQILPAIAVAIFNDNKEILLQKRKDVNRWCILSGHVEFGETVEEAVLREISEEINVTGEIVRFIGVYSSPISQTYQYSDKSIQYVTLYFEAKLLNEIDPDFSNSETKELKYFSPKSIPDDMAMMSPHWLSDALSTDNKVVFR
jgi:8-oxo-dGTP pyrophosphatase MutT (NUDIX family)